MAAPLRVTETQALAFRARRGHLLGPGGADPVTTARRLLGAQAQQLAPALFALSQRTAGRPTAAALAPLLLEDRPTLVRTWGQRDTLHVYDPADWTTVVAAREGWAHGGRRVAMPRPQDLDAARALLHAASGPITREHLFGTMAPDFLAIAEPHIVKHAKWMLPADYTPEALGQAVERFCAGRLLWCLGNEGDACSGGKVGSQQAYQSRLLGFPELVWDPPTETDANVALTRRTLAVCAPATATDVGHFLGARVRDSKAWLAALADELIEVDCGGRKGLVALAADADALTQAPPDAWPVRLLPLWDTLLMTHADKSWIAPDPSEHKAIWKKAAMVCATVLDQGRIVATWKHKVLSKRVDVGVSPLGGWRKSRHLRGVVREAHAVAVHLGRAEAQVSVG